MKLMKCIPLVLLTLLLPTMAMALAKGDHVQVQALCLSLDQAKSVVDAYKDGGDEAAFAALNKGDNCIVLPGPIAEVALDKVVYSSIDKYGTVADVWAADGLDKDHTTVYVFSVSKGKAS